MILMDNKKERCNILVVGVGDAGCQAVYKMIDKIEEIQYACVNTDGSSLLECRSEVCIQIGRDSTGGLGADGKPDVGEKAVYGSKEKIEELVKACDLLFVVSGMGGGTGTGASPVIAEIAKNAGVLTVGLVISPFEFEGKVRNDNAKIGIERMKKVVDSLIILSNDKLLNIDDPRMKMSEALGKAYDVFCDVVCAFKFFYCNADLIQLDVDDVKKLFTDMGLTYVGSGCAKGENKHISAIKEALNNPLSVTNMADTTDVLIFINGDFGLLESDEIGKIVKDILNEDANIIIGANYEDAFEDMISVTVIASGCA